MKKKEDRKQTQFKGPTGCFCLVLVERGFQSDEWREIKRVKIGEKKFFENCVLLDGSGFKTQSEHSYVAAIRTNLVATWFKKGKNLRSQLFRLRPTVRHHQNVCRPKSCFTAKEMNIDIGIDGHTGPITGPAQKIRAVQ